MIQPERIQLLNSAPVIRGRYVLYWMQASQRATCNHALEYAVRQANQLGLPLVVVFGLTDRFPEANLRHYSFMLHGLVEVRDQLRRRRIQMVLLHASPEQACLRMGADAALVVTDRGYLRVQVRWRADAAAALARRLVQIESDAVVPVEVVSDKEEYAARTIRPRIWRHLERYLQPLGETALQHSSVGMELPGVDLDDTGKLLGKLKLDRSVGQVSEFLGGTDHARALLDDFVQHKLDLYAERSSNPSADFVSHMSPYLHFGQMSPLQIALRVMETGSPGADAYLEQLIVRRELSLNMVRLNPEYDSYGCLPGWAQQTLQSHADDPRPYTYDLEQFEQARTHDPYWNAAQRQMLLTGKMHNYMRMYWGKKILEWCASPQQAYEIALYLNNKYELDGRDPNGFAGVAWCFGKHDRPWKERPIFGKVRYMNAAGLERKFDMARYVSRFGPEPD